MMVSLRQTYLKALCYICRWSADVRALSGTVRQARHAMCGLEQCGVSEWLDIGMGVLEPHPQEQHTAVHATIERIDTPQDPTRLSEAPTVLSPILPTYEQRPTLNTASTASFEIGPQPWPSLSICLPPKARARLRGPCCESSFSS